MESSTDKSAPPNDGAARSKVLATMELLEKVLLHLRTNDLLRAQLVCSTWESVILSSPTIQTALFLKAVSETSAPKPSSSSRRFIMSGIPSAAIIHQDIIKQSSQGSFAVNTSFLTGPFLNQDASKRTAFRLSLPRLQKCVNDISPHRWAFVTQPPSKTLQLYVKATITFTEIYHQLCKDLAKAHGIEYTWGDSIPLPEGGFYPEQMYLKQDITLYNETAVNLMDLLDGLNGVVAVCTRMRLLDVVTLVELGMEVPVLGTQAEDCEA